MKIESIKISNFRQFYANVSLDFSTDVGKNVTVVHGANGSGKTSLLNAFKWCFYGKTDFDTGSDTILNKAAIEQADPGEPIVLQVSVKFSHERLRYQATRTQGYVRKGGVIAESDGSEKFHLDVTGEDGQTKRSNSPQSEMLGILPDNLQPYFFFNGERIEKLAGTNHSSQIQQAIKNLMGLELVDRAIQHLAKAKSAFRKETKKYASEEIAECQIRCARLEENIRRCEEQRASAKAAKEEAESELSSIDAKLKSFEKSRELQEERQSLVSRTGKIFNDIADTERKQKALIGESGFLMLCDDVLSKCSAIVEENRKKGVLPYKIKEQFIDDLIDLGKCICGSEITGGSKEHKELLETRKRAGSENLEGNFIRLSALLNDHGEAKSRFTRHYSDLAKRLLELTTENEKTSGRISDISAALESVNESKIVELEKNHREFSRLRDDALQDEGIAKRSREELKSELAEQETMLARLELQQGKVTALQARIESADTVGKAFEELYESLADHVREDLSTRVNETFRSIIRKPLMAVIDEEYRLQIMAATSAGEEYSVTEQSTGEKQVTSLSFIASIIALAREQHGRSTTFFQGGLYPLVMDSPFGALDADYREKVASNVAALAEQVVIFVSNSQWAGEVRQACEARVGRSYRLVYHSPHQDSVNNDYMRKSETGYEYTTIDEADL